MSTWNRLSLDNLQAAQVLVRADHWRSTVSRCHYAAYSALTGELLRSAPTMKFPHGYRNPPHSRLPAYIENHFDKKRFSEKIRRKLAEAFSGLKDARIDADYRPASRIGKLEATQSLQLARMIMRKIGLKT